MLIKTYLFEERSLLVSPFTVIPLYIFFFGFGSPSPVWVLYSKRDPLKSSNNILTPAQETSNPVRLRHGAILSFDPGVLLLFFLGERLLIILWAFAFNFYSVFFSFVLLWSTLIEISVLSKVIILFLGVHPFSNVLMVHQDFKSFTRGPSTIFQNWIIIHSFKKGLKPSTKIKKKVHRRTPRCSLIQNRIAFFHHFILPMITAHQVLFLPLIILLEKGSRFF